MTKSSLTEPALDQPRPPFTFLGFQIHRKIRTGEKHISWISVFLLTLIWFTWGVNMCASGTALTFTIKRYCDRPMMIQLVLNIATAVMLGPIFSYLSDHIWTRAGRRRPFIIMAWLGGFVSMSVFAFLPQFMSAINHGMTAVGLFPINALFLLAIIIFCYKKLWDGATPLEPLFLECVPPHQRGRFFAMRGMAFTLSLTFFFQILYPQFDNKVDMFSWLGYPHALILTGEQAIYSLSAGLFLLTGFFVVFCVEEVRMPQAPNKSFREIFLGKKTPDAANSPTTVATPTTTPLPAPKGPLQKSAPPVSLPPSFLDKIRHIPIVAFLINFFRDVFFKPENYPYYLVLVIPGLEMAIWGSLGALMQNDQFGYSKQTQADWAFPMQIVGFCALTPFAGWYSDVRVKIRWWLRILLLAVSAGSFLAMLYVAKINATGDIRLLPEFYVLMEITVLTAISVLAVYIVLTETLLDLVGREHARAWVSLLTILNSMVIVITLYTFIQHSPGQVIPVMDWMILQVIYGVMQGQIATFVAPMVYDYMRRSQMGTVTAGQSVLGSLAILGAGLLGGKWVEYYSAHIHHPAGCVFEYSSLYLLQMAMFMPILCAKGYFVYVVITGKLKKWGDMEVEDPQEALVEEKAAHVLEDV